MAKIIDKGLGKADSVHFLCPYLIHAHNGAKPPTRTLPADTAGTSHEPKAPKLPRKGKGQPKAR